MTTPSNEKMLQSEIATRLKRTDWYAFGNGILPNPDPVLRKAGVFHREIDDMWGDPFIYSLFANRRGGVMSYEWRIDSGNAESSSATLIETWFNSLNMALLIQQVLKSVASGMEVFEIPRYTSQSGVWLPAPPVLKPRQWFAFDVENNLRYHSNTGEPEGVVVINYSNPESAPPEQRFKFIAARSNPTYNNPYGDSLLTRCYWNHFFKKEGKKFWAIFTEQFGMPWVVGEYLEGIGQDKIDEFLTSLQQMIAGRVIVGPDSSKINVANTTTSGSSDNYELFLRDARYEITMLILGHEAMSRSSGSKLGNDTTELTAARWLVEADMWLVTDFFNELIRYIYELNNLGGERPRFVMYQKEEIDLKVAERDTLDYGMGVRFSKSYFVKTRGYADDDFEIAAPTPTKPQKPHPAAPFAASDAQDEVDRWVERLSADAGTGNALVAQMMESVLAYINEQSNFEDAIASLHTVYPDMNVDIALDVATEIAAGTVFGYYAAQSEESGDAA
ncbi:MAG: DUF935 family protein [Candidatus Kapabacteria bacterium]|nr:DUF935 family protein [Candidatus Kapabacteria bacterium]